MEFLSSEVPNPFLDFVMVSLSFFFISPIIYAFEVADLDNDWLFRDLDAPNNDLPDFEDIDYWFREFPLLGLFRDYVPEKGNFFDPLNAFNWDVIDSLKGD